MVGPDGFAMLLLSNLTIIITGGLSFLWCFIYTLKTGRQAQSTETSSSIKLVPGMRLSGGELPSDYRLRLEKAHELYKLAKNSRIIVLGGKTGSGDLSEAEEGKKYLVKSGVLENDVLVEDKSCHTLENLQGARLILSKGNYGAPVIISNRYHLARCHAMAKGLGIEHSVCAAENELKMNPWTIALLTKEAFYTHWYLVGKAWSKFTNNKKILGRIS